MATFTVTTAVNIDTLSVRAGDDTFNVNGGQLTIDEDSRYGLNATTSTIMGNITGSATLGGDIFIDARAVRLIPYDTGTGNVPAYNTVITQGGASGKMIGVYDDLTVAPTAPGAAMPVNGYIKIKQWNTTPYAAGALTGIGANATGADVVGWITIVGAETRTFTLNGLNNTSTKVIRGAPDMYLIGTTPGSPARSDTYQIPSNGGLVYHAGVFVETAASSGAYEFWPTTVDTALLANIETDNYRGKYCWISTAGVLTFGNDGTNSTGGALPPAGAKVKIGNIFMTNATTGAPTVNVAPNTTTATRFEFSIGTLGNLEMEYASCNWACGAIINGRRFNMNYVGICAPISAQQIGEEMQMTNSGYGTPVTCIDNGFAVITGIQGANFDNFTFGRGNYNTANRDNLQTNICSNIVINNCRFTHTGARIASTNYAFRVLTTNGVEVTNSVLGGFVTFATGSDVYMSGNSYYFSAAGQPSLTNNNQYVWQVAGFTDVLIEDELFPFASSGQVGYSGLIHINTSSRNVTVRSLGSYVAPLDFSTYSEQGAAYARVTTVVTVTTAAPHGLRTGDTIVIYRSDSASGNSRTTRVLTGTPTSTTFTYTVTNAGNTSGFISFYTGNLLQPFNVGQTSNVNTKIQDVWIRGHYGSLYLVDTSSNQTYLLNVNGDPRYTSHQTIRGTETYIRSQLTNSEAAPVFSATLGTHMESVFTSDEGLTGKTAQAWTRATTTITVTATAHGLLTSDYIQTYNSSSETAIPPGRYLVTVTDANTFFFTAINAGSASGTVSYKTTDARLGILMNDASSATTSQVVVTSGTPKFTGAGSLVTLTLGDQLYWETPEYELAFDNFASVLPIVLPAAQMPNHDLAYQIDRGAGFSGWNNYYYNRAGGGGSSASTNVTMTSTTGVVANDYVYGVGIAEGAKVQSITNATTIVVTIANISAVSGTLVFNYAPNETQFPTTGVKLKLRLTNSTATTTALTNIMGFFEATATTRQNLFPFEVDTYSFTVSGIPSGGTIALYDSTDTELQREDNITGGEFVYEYVHSGTDFEDNYYVFWHEDYYAYKSPVFDLTAADSGASVVPEDDLAYDAAAPDISTFNFGSKIHIMDPTVGSGGDVDIPITELYSNWKDEIFLSDNFTYDFAYRVVGGQPTYSSNFVSLNFFQINGWKLRPKEINHTGRITGGNLIPEADGAIIPTTGSYTALVEYQNPERSIAVSGGSDPTDIAAAVWSDSDTYAVGEKGDDIKATMENSDVTQAKVDQL